MILVTYSFTRAILLAYGLWECVGGYVLDNYNELKIHNDYKILIQSVVLNFVFKLIPIIK